MLPRLLVLDDDDGIRTALALAMEDEGYAVVEAADAESALAVVAAEPVDVMLVDLMLGGLDGFTFIRHVRRRSDVPIIVVSARGASDDVVLALEAGADDYVTKPFDVAVVTARLRALRRRVRPAAERAAAAAGSPGPAGTTSTPGVAGAVPAGGGVVLDSTQDLLLDEPAGVVRRRGEEVHLTVTEFRLLCELAASAGRVLSRSALLDRVWQRGYFGEERLVDVHIRRLRTKVEVDPAEPALVVTVRGLGYRLDRR